MPFIAQPDKMGSQKWLGDPAITQIGREGKGRVSASGGGGTRTVNVAPKSNQARNSKTYFADTRVEDTRSPRFVKPGDIKRTAPK